MVIYLNQYRSHPHLLSEVAAPTTAHLCTESVYNDFHVSHGRLKHAGCSSVDTHYIHNYVVRWSGASLFPVTFYIVPHWDSLQGQPTVSQQINSAI